MAINKIYKFQDIDEANLFLNGGIIGGQTKNGFSGLVGRKIKFVLPAAVEYTFVTGSGTDPHVLSIKDIKTQLEGAVAGLLVRTINGKLVLIEAAPSGGVSLDDASSLEARGLLGLQPEGAYASNVYEPPPSVTAPCWTFATVGTDNSHIVYTWE